MASSLNKLRIWSVDRSSPRERETRSPSRVFRPVYQTDQRICTISPDGVVV
jgi:hypothetical protein